MIFLSLLCIIIPICASLFLNSYEDNSVNCKGMSIMSQFALAHTISGLAKVVVKRVQKGVRDASAAVS